MNSAPESGTRETRPSGEGEVRTPGPETIEELYKRMGVKEHWILKLPTAEKVQVLLAQPNGKEEFFKFLKNRQERLRLAEADPLEWGFEAETWKDADRLLQGEGCTFLGIFGGNRAQKTWYGIKRTIQCAEYYPGGRFAICSESLQASQTTVQPLVWFYLEPMFGNWNGKRHDIVKINYSQGNGFTQEKIVLPNKSEIYFLTYNQDPGDYEGWEFGVKPDTYREISEQRREQKLFVPPNIGTMDDESMPLAWLKMLSRRLPFREAKGVWTFTPVKGMTPAIKEFVGSSAQTLESRPAELLPRRNLPELPDGHMPYIRKCAFPNGMAIYFHTIFNKFGPSLGRTYYDEVKNLCDGKSSEIVERIAYGYARDTVARAFPKFGPENIVKRWQLPAVGTNYQLNDPAGSRNWAMIWARVSAGDPACIYIYRDWPDAQRYGEWAVTTEREINAENRKGWDGDPGPAQIGFGYGVTKYKQTILECEKIVNHRWTQMDTDGLLADPAGYGKKKNMDPYHVRLILRALKSGMPLEELREEIAERYVDPRAGRSEHIAEAGGTCIIDEFDDVQIEAVSNKVTGPSMELLPASGVELEEGIGALNELLDWNKEMKLVPMVNQPRLFVCEDCVQVIWMFENFTGLSGEKGASKDFADLGRYLALAKLEYLEEGYRGKAGRGF